MDCLGSLTFSAGSKRSSHIESFSHSLQCFMVLYLIVLVFPGVFLLMFLAGSKRSSRIEFETLPASARGDFTFTFDFKTFSNNSIIFYASSSDHRDFVTFYIKDGMVNIPPCKIQIMLWVMWKEFFSCKIVLVSFPTSTSQFYLQISYD